MFECNLCGETDCECDLTGLIVACEECGGSGFSKVGTGFDVVCDNCGGQGERPYYENPKEEME